MSCEFILTRGKNKGKQCSSKGTRIFFDTRYCSRHCKMKEKDMMLNETRTMQKEDWNCNENSVPAFGFIREIGKGAFGRVLMIQDTKTKEKYAMKTANNRAKHGANLLFYEYTLLSQHFAGNKDFPQLLPKVSASYKRGAHETYLIFEYFEETLSQRCNRCTLSNEKVKSYGLQILNIIEYIHSLNFLYIDIKPENFMFKTKDDESVKIIDFGLCQRYVDYKGQHIGSKTLSNPIGTDLYASVRMLSCTQSGRIDDIECIGYLLLYLYHGELPWSSASSSSEILEMKQACTMFENTPDYIWKFIQSSRAVKSFDATPDYNLFKALLTV